MTEKVPGCVWTNEAVTLLLSLYLREQQKERPVKLKKKEIWKNICQELWSCGLLCSWQECDKKYRNLKQTFVRNLKQAGKKECRWMFFPIMLEINRHEPFVNEMVNSALFHNISSSNNSTSDYENDKDEEEEDDNCSSDETLFPPAINASLLQLSQKNSSSELTNDSNKWHKYSTIQQRSQMYQPYSLSPLVQQHLQLQQQQHHQQRSQKSPTPSSLPSSQRAQSPNKPYDNVQSPITKTHISAYDDSPPTCSTTQDDITNSDANCNKDEPPEWFTIFLTEFKKQEEKKLQKIQELCDEVRRTNDIENQRNVILNERNDILKNMIDFMSTK